MRLSLVSKSCLEMLGSRDEESSSGSASAARGITAGVDRDLSRQLRDADAARVERLADPFLRRSGQAQAPQGVKRGHFEERDRRNAEGAGRLGLRQQLARAAPDALGVAVHTPQPDMGVEQQHAVSRSSMSYPPSMGSKGRWYSRIVPFMDPKNGFLLGSW